MCSSVGKIQGLEDNLHVVPCYRVAATDLTRALMGHVNTQVFVLKTTYLGVCKAFINMETANWQ